MTPKSLLQTLLAQDVARDTLYRAIAGDRVHHAYLFDGPAGVGKELAAFGLAQALVCEARKAGEQSACGECSACKRAVPREDTTLPLHPDVIVIERGRYEPARIGRKSPESQEISIDQIRTLVLARSAFGPHEGRAKVFIIRRAEELSISAANALLKTLEEPDPKTHFVLLTSARAWLLPTILSRTLPIRFGALPDKVVQGLLAARGVDTEAARAAAIAAQGSMEAALAQSDTELLDRRRAFVERCLEAAVAATSSQALEIAEHEKKDKLLLVDNLGWLATQLAAHSRAATKEPSTRAVAFAEAHAHVLSALRDIDANGSPQLAVESLFFKLRALPALRSTP